MALRVKSPLGACLLFAALAGCGDSGPPVDEAWRVGYDMGIADVCGRDGIRKEPMPSAYDDSLGKGELSAAFQAGYQTARSEARPCR